MNVINLPVSRSRTHVPAYSPCGGTANEISDHESFLANRTGHDPLARAAAKYLPPPDDSSREPCVRALVVALRFLPSHHHLREEDLETLESTIGNRNDLILEEVRAARNRPEDSDLSARWTLRCALEARHGRGGMERLGVIAVLHRLHRFAACFP